MESTSHSRIFLQRLGYHKARKPSPVSHAPPLLQFDLLSIGFSWIFFFFFPSRFGIISFDLFLSPFAGVSSLSVLGYCPSSAHPQGAAENPGWGYSRAALRIADNK